MERHGFKTDVPPKIRNAISDDIDTMKRVLARAFDADPFHKWYVIQDKKRIARLETHFETYLKHYVMKHDHVFVTEEVNAVAAWFPPEPEESWKLSTLKELSLMDKWVSIMGVRKLRIVQAGVDRLKKHHLKTPHFFLAYLGVDPELQGKGIGAGLLRHGLNMCTQDRLPAYLETSAEQNVPYYEKHGFTVLEEFELERGPRIWTMIYRPQ